MKICDLCIWFVGCLYVKPNFKLKKELIEGRGKGGCEEILSGSR